MKHTELAGRLPGDSRLIAAQLHTAGLSGPKLCANIPLLVPKEAARCRLYDKLISILRGGGGGRFN